MTDIKDYFDHLVCKVDEVTGFVEASYKKQTTSTYLSIGESFVIDRNGVVTVITRDSYKTFKVERHIAAA